ncbi:MAG: crotonase/enoyl-CoA hydratase family protein, partial [Solirubrobacterales bacterium]|nr:crotonase/enoyl-CoA hydratase family protein [Solirubrobacterales bacterium]
RVVILHGEGPSFCSGLDVSSSFSSEDEAINPNQELLGEVPNRFQRVAYDWVRLPVPVIASIHGNCLGGGLQIALGADIRVAAPDARLSVMEVKWGLIPDMSITQTLPRLVGLDVAKELTFTGRVFSGEEALGLGVVTRLSAEPLETAHELAAEIATKSPNAVQGAKQLFEESWSTTPREGLALEAQIQRQLIGSPNQIAAITAGLTRQPAEFVDPDLEPA